MVPLDAYSDSIALFTPFDRSRQGGTDRTDALQAVFDWLLAESEIERGSAPIDDRARRELVKRLLTVRPARPIPAEALERIDALFAHESCSRPIATLADVLAGPHVPVTIAGSQVQLWRGDITRLQVDAIVNAANRDLLGCFVPAHRCIDNAIHTVAGPRLRNDCKRIMDMQGHREPTGAAKVTRAYYLPSRFVLHTVGPIVPDGHVTSDDRQQLTSCYESCLDLAATVGVKSVAFCAVSTGLFGYPKGDAAHVATRTVRTWLEQHPGALDTVVLNVFGEADEQAYRNLDMLR